jgi:IclR family acetate operon transcriptional repressor
MNHEAGSPRSLMRLLGLFEAIAKTENGLTLARLSEVLDSPKSSLLLLLRPLVAKGYLLHEAGVYRLGAAIFRLASDILSTRSFPKLVRPLMEELAVRSQETVFLAAIDRDDAKVAYVERIDSPQAIRYTAPVGSARPLYCSAAGKLLLAFQDEAWRDEYLRAVKLKKMTPRTVTSRTALRSELEKIRKTGVAVSIGEAIPGAAGVAAPIFNADKSVAAALLIGAPVDRFQREHERLRGLVKELAAKASGLLGTGGA